MTRRTVPQKRREVAYARAHEVLRWRQPHTEITQWGEDELTTEECEHLALYIGVGKMYQTSIDGMTEWVHSSDQVLQRDIDTIDRLTGEMAAAQGTIMMEFQWLEAHGLLRRSMRIMSDAVPVDPS